MSAVLGRLLPGPAHFQVVEDPAYLPSGSGEHLFVDIEKEGLTTDEVATALARACGTKPMNIGYAGRKDRHAITRQWFSVLGGKDEQLAALPTTFAKGRLTVRAVSRHGNKIRTGHLEGNRFRLGLGDVNDPAALGAALAQLERDGLANRFGPQRFGFAGVNLRICAAWGRGDLDAAAALIVDPGGTWKAGDPLPDGFRMGPEGRVLGALRRGVPVARALEQGDELRKLIASAAQAAIFNAVLDARVAAGLVHRLRPGDVACLRSGAPFTVAASDLDDVNRRAAPGLLEVMATGPMPGTWRIQPTDTVLAEEHAWSAATGIDWAWFQARACFDSPGGRRGLVVPFRAPPLIETIADVTWVELSLPSGAFATEVLTQAGITLPADRRG